MLPKTELAIPVVPNGAIDQIHFDLSQIYVAESRMEEVANVTPQTAPELLALFNKAYLDLTEMLSVLTYEETRAEKECSRLRSLLLIDRIPGIVKEKGLANSADIRNALVEGDLDYQAARDKADFMHASLELLKGKLKSMEMAFSSVKKIIDGSNYNMAGKAGRQRLDGILEESATAGQTQARPLFGKPRHN